MDAVIVSRIAHETAISEISVLATVALFEKGATGPFIVHYRKEATGGLDETKVRLIQERMDYYREVRDKRTALLKSLSEQDKLTDEIKARIEKCLTKVELDDLHHQFRSKKKVRSAEAIKKGLEPLAEYFWNQEPDAWSIEEHIKVFVEASKELSTPEEALQGIVDIIAEWTGANFEYRRTLREMLEKNGFVISNVVPAKVNQKTKYNMYYERRESVTTIPSHRVLAIRRGCKEGVLISSIEGDHPKALEFLLSSVIKDRESIFAPVLEAAIRESYNRILKPLIETEVRTQLKEQADREAIRVFQENLSNLLLSPPAGPIVVMGVDWGKDEECSVGVVSETGAFLEKAKIRFTESSKSRRAGNGKQSSRKKASPDAQAAGQKSNSKVLSASVETENSIPAFSISGLKSLSGTSTREVISTVVDPPTNRENANPVATETPKESLVEPEKIEAETPAVDKSDAEDVAPPTTLSTEQKELEQAGAPETETPVIDQSDTAENVAQSPVEIVQEPQSEASTSGEDLQAVDQPDATVQEPPTGQPQPDPVKTEETSGPDIPEPVSTQEEAAVQPESPETNDDASLKDSATDVESAPKPVSTQEKAILTDTPPIEPLAAATVKEEAPPKEDTSEKIETAASTSAATGSELEFEKARKLLKDLITKHNVRALSIGTGTRARELESALKRIVTEENLGDILIAAVNDAGIAIYSSSRIAREEFPDWNPSARCAVSLARRLQDPLAELVKIDPKLIGVGQYQHDVDQKELHRKLLRTVQFCVNKVGVNVNTASESLLRYISGLNEKTARRIMAYRNNQGPFPSRDSIPTAVGIDTGAYEQAAGFLRIPAGENLLDRTAIHPESYPIILKMASVLEIEINELIGNRERVTSLKLEDFVTDTLGIPTLKDIREELLKPGRDPRKTFKLPNFRADVTDMSDLKIGMTLEGTVTNVTNFGAFVDIGVRQDGLVHLSQMSNRFIRDPREAVKVGDIVQVKVISIETETKRIGLSIKALLPAANKRRRKPQKNTTRQSQSAKKDGAAVEKKAGTASPASSDKSATAKGRSKPNRSHSNSSRFRKKGDHKPEKANESKQKKESAPELPERSLQEKIEFLQSKFRGIN